jgi:hypothetical protein
VCFVVSGYNQQDRTQPDSAKGYPPLFIVDRIVAVRKSIRVVKHERRSLKAEAVFAKVSAIFAIVSGEEHEWSRPGQYEAAIICCQYECTYKDW